MYAVSGLVAVAVSPFWSSGSYRWVYAGTLMLSAFIVTPQRFYRGVETCLAALAFFSARVHQGAGTY